MDVVHKRVVAKHRGWRNRRAIYRRRLAIKPERSLKGLYKLNDVRVRDE
jgi:hypothetical protein